MTEQKERTSLLQTIEVFIFGAITLVFLWSIIAERLWPRIIASALIVLMTTRRALRQRDRSGFITGGFISATAGLGVARKLSEGAGGDAALLASVVVVALFVVPLPLIVWLYARGSDEFQRSMVTASAAIALMVTIAASLGYWILERAIELPRLEMLWVGLGATAIWGLSWAILRGRAA